MVAFKIGRRQGGPFSTQPSSAVGRLAVFPRCSLLAYRFEICSPPRPHRYAKRCGRVAPWKTADWSGGCRAICQLHM